MKSRSEAQLQGLITDGTMTEFSPLDDSVIAALESKLRDAQLSSDVQALEALISEDLLFTGPDGQLITKAADLGAYATGFVKFVTHEPEELRVRWLSLSTAITALRARIHVKVNGEDVQQTVRYTRIWSSEADGAWRVVGGHVSAVEGSAAGGD